MKLIDAFTHREYFKEEFEIPGYDREKVKKATNNEPIWIHFGAGNIFRSFIAASMDRLIEEGVSEKGIIVCEDFDQELVEKVYLPYDCLSLLVTLKADGTIQKRVVGSVVEAVSDEVRMLDLVKMPSVQMVSFTITEKGYHGPLMNKITTFLYGRYQDSKAPIALVSMDNCAHNGKILQDAILTQADRMVKEQHVDAGFLDYLNDTSLVTFPWTMIDKITPRPDESVGNMLKESGFMDTDQIITKFHTYTAPFVNAEETQYLVIEDSFPNGRPQLERAGILFASRETVDKTEKMKVGTCLNPLHTALAIFGCLLGYHTIHEEMKDHQLNKLITTLGFREGMPVVVDPGIIKPEDFLRDVLTLRLPNPFMPDTPQRIATDTSQKIPVRYGQTLKSYELDEHLNLESLSMIPLIFAGWLRYLLGIDDEGRAFLPSPDPRLSELQEKLLPYLVKGFELEENQNCSKKCSMLRDDSGMEAVLDDILKDESIFVIDLFACGMAERIKKIFFEMTQGIGAVRKTLVQYVGTVESSDRENVIE